MLVNFSNVQNIFIVCGHTDMRCGIDGLAGIITDKYNLDLFNDVDVIQVGARNMQNFELLKELGHSKKAILNTTAFHVAHSFHTHLLYIYSITRFRRYV